MNRNDLLKSIENILVCSCKQQGIFCRWDFVFSEHYHGFIMDGFNSSNYENLSLLSKFSHYMTPFNDSDYRSNLFILPKFWKGSCVLFNLEDSRPLADMSNNSSSEIILKIIELRNPNIVS